MEYKYTPKTKTALIAAIRAEIKLKGARADLNCIDTSAITNMRELFAKFKSFNGDISQWNVSNVTDMSDMFSGSSFVGDISAWDVDKVEYFFNMFKWCRIPQEHRPVRFRMHHDGNSPDLNGKVRFWNDTEASFSLTGDGVLTVSGDLSCDLSSGFYHGIDGEIPVRKLIITEGVTTIGERMFYQWRRLEEVTFPESLTEIKDSAFAGCRNIAKLNFPENGLISIGSSVFSSCPVKELRLPGTLTYIGSYTFEGFKELEELVIPDSVESVGKWRVFHDCTSLKSVKLPAHLKTITESMFSGCADLEHVQMPEDLESIERHAFADCSKLRDLALPDSVDSIEDDSLFVEFEEGGLQYRMPAFISKIRNCSVSVCDWEGPLSIPSTVSYKGKEYVVNAVDDFYRCGRMTEARIPDTITSLPVRAFAGCERLKIVELPDTMTEIPDEAFDGCWRLREVHLGSRTEVIGESAFRGCEFLQHIDLPASLKRIRSYAFQDCKNLVSVDMSESIEFIGLYAFEGTPIMDQDGPVYLGKALCGYGGPIPAHTCLEVREGTTVIAEAAFRECGNLESVILPESLERIGYEAFNECRKLRHVYLPSSLTYIGDGAFDYTPVLEVEAPWINPIGIDYRSFPEGTVVYVPVGSKDAYMNAKYWCGYKIVEKEGARTNPYDFTTDETVFIGRKEPQRVILMEHPRHKYPYCLYGVATRSKVNDASAKESVKDLLYESFRDTAAFLDWEEDRDFGGGESLSTLLEYSKHRYVVVELPADASPKTLTINGRVYLTDEDLYKSLVSNNLDWVKLEE